MAVVDIHQPPDKRPARCAILTVSDTRTPETDTSGQAVHDLLTGDGYVVTHRDLVPDDAPRIAGVVATWCQRPDIRIVIVTGGSGIAARDSTIEALRPLFSKELTGFGELFRMLSYNEIGAAAMLSRATAGVVNSRAVFILPGSENAVRLGMTSLILPQLAHVAKELEK